MTTKLTDIKTDEVSLVGKGANRKKFLLFKSKEGTMEELLKELLEETKAIEGEKDLLADLKKGKFSAEEISAVQASIRMLSGLADKIKKAGITVKAFETKADPPKIERKDVGEFLRKSSAADRAEMAKQLGVDPTRFEEAFGTPKATDGAVLKADGSLNLDAVPKELQPAMSLLFKDRAETAKKLKDAEEKIEKADKEKKRAVWINKAAEFKDLPGTNVEELADTLMELSDEGAERITKQLRSNLAIIEKGDFFTEHGRHGGGGGTGTAIEKVNQLVTGLIQKNDKLDQTAAMSLVMRENPALYQEYVKETQIRA
jgi:hypothetical protein